MLAKKSKDKMPPAIRVTLVDDDRDDFILIRDLLNDVQHTQYEIQWIGNSAEGIEAIRRQDSDVYLIDYQIDERTGLDVLSQFKFPEMEKPVLLLTGQQSLKLDIQAMELGAFDFLPKKDITADILERSIRYAIQHKKDQQSLLRALKTEEEKKALERGAVEKSQFFAQASHEIRNPLGAILGFAEEAMDPNVSDEDRMEFLGIIKKNGEHLLGLVNDILDLSKIEAGHVDVLLEDFKWRDVIGESLELFTPKAAKKNIMMNFDLGEGIPEVFHSDVRRFRQILLNLLSNAIKFTESGVIRISCFMSDGQFNLLIRDTGVGISEGDQKNLFQPFHQANKKLVQKYGGTGLGLDLSRKLAVALGGSLELVESKLGSGSTFAFRLPV